MGSDNRSRPGDPGDTRREHDMEAMIRPKSDVGEGARWGLCYYFRHGRTAYLALYDHSTGEVYGAEWGAYWFMFWCGGEMPAHRLDYEPPPPITPDAEMLLVRAASRDFFYPA